jgi:hypothetical protein
VESLCNWVTSMPKLRTMWSATAVSKLARFASIGFVLPGSVTSRTSRCGNPGCVCHVDETRHHGPYLTWTRKFENKILTRALSTEQLERYRPWFEEHRRLRALTKDLELVSIHAANRIEQWGLPD